MYLYRYVYMSIFVWIYMLLYVCEHYKELMKGDPVNFNFLPVNICVYINMYTLVYLYEYICFYMYVGTIKTQWKETQSISTF
jgi:hypothetical protein